MVSNDQAQGYKKIHKVKTFPVPFFLGDIKENLTINTNTPSTPSNEKLINQAFRLHSQGNIQEAAKYYQHILNQGLKDHRVFSNYGTILQNLGQLQEAELLYRKAIELNPYFAEAHSNLGNVFRDLGNLKEAELSLRKAMN